MNERSIHRRPRGLIGFRILCLCVAVACGCGLGPGPLAARQRMSFTPGDGSRHAFHQRRSRGASKRYALLVRRPHPSRHAAQGDADGASAVPPPPGSGFKMIDGVLTYPAPARFQPKNLKRD